MTRRERLERKVELRREWAEKRRAKAGGLLAVDDRLRADWAFATQPGHIPERARMIRREDKAYEHLGIAGHHVQKAAGLEQQLDRTIFSDDPDAIEALEAKAAAKDSEADRANAINRAWRKHKGDESALFAAWQALGCSIALCRSLAANARQYSWTERRGPCDPSHARTEARRCRERIKQVRQQQARQSEADDAGGVSIRLSGHQGDWAVVTFAEKPDRAILAELKAAGFRWGSGSWCGRADALPESVRSLAD